MLASHDPVGAARPPAASALSPTALGAARRALLAILLLLGPLSVLATLFLPQLNQPMPADGLMHAVSSGSAAVMGALLSLLVLRIAQRARDSRVLLIGLTMLLSALVFLLHALTTPGIIYQNSGAVVGLTAELTLIVAGIGFGVSGLHLSERLNRVITRHSLWLTALALLGFGWLAAALLADLQPALGAAPQPHDHGAAAGAAPTLGGWLTTLNRQPLRLLAALGFAAAIVRHRRLYRRSPSALSLSIVCGVALFGVALVVQQVAKVYAPLFWIYHLMEVAGFGVIGAAVIMAYRRGLVDETLLESLFLPGTRQRVQANFTRAFDELTTMLASGERPLPAQRMRLSDRYGMTDGQIEAMAQAAAAVARERQQREELQRLNVALQQLERDKNQLTQLVVHDLKTPLTALVGFLEILRLESLSPAQRELLDSALRSGRSLAGLIGDLLDIAQMSEGRLRLHRRSLPLRLLVEDCAAELAAWLSQEEKSVQIDCSDDLQLDADERLVRRVLLNLISNAIKHTPSYARITVRAEQLPDATVVEVIDDGPGVDPALLERLFEPYARGAERDGAAQSNTGLGLSFCRMAAEAHGGRMEIVSQPGEGATFRLVLPQVA